VQNIKELSDRISATYGNMSPNFRKIAAFILDNPDEIALSSMRKNAKQIGINPSNFVRFARYLSFDGYPQLRQLFQYDLKEKKYGYFERAQSLQKHHKAERISSIISELQQANNENLNSTFSENSITSLKNTARTLLDARHIYIFGMRICFPAAFALHYTCKMMREHVYLSEGLGGTIADDMRGMGKDDAFVAIGMDPYSNETVNATRYAVKSGATVIALTDSTLSPLAIKSDIIQTFSHKGPLVPGTILPLMALIEAITIVMIAKSGTKALDAIKISEQQLKEFHAYYSQ
jgi:DNA-binding MurR/RpiR family transcriptional regulator